MSEKDALAITYSSNLDGVSWPEMAGIFVAVGWGDREPEKIERAFRRSSFVRVAWAGEKIAGFGRTFDDGEFYGSICDLVVAPEYQGRGIGSRILRELREAMRDFRFATLTAAPGKDGFYLKEGWKRQSSAFIWPRNEQQALNHAKQDAEEAKEHHAPQAHRHHS